MKKIKFKYQPFQNHLDNFSLVWIGFMVLIVAASFAAFNCWGVARVVLLAGLVMFFLLLLCFPMNSVYGLIGARGSIEVFFLALVLINLVFSGIYYFGFYQRAGICYDINQPHISFDYYRPGDPAPAQIYRDTVYLHGLQSEDGAIPYFVLEEKHDYQKVTYGKVLRNTIMTSLMQEPTDLFAATAVYNGAIDCNSVDESKSNYFHWLLILQILISWILLGVFISILYNKFRYES